MPTTSSLVFATCQVSAQTVMKEEVAHRHPDWRPAYSRPGFVSWKLPAPRGPEFARPSVLAHTHGLALGRCDFEGAAPAILETLARQAWDRAPVLHCHARAVSPTREIRNPLEPLADDLRQGLLATGKFAPAVVAAPGDLVFDVLVVDADAVIFGCHAHEDSHSPYAGGNPPLSLPEEAPSRAWLKFEEAMLWHPRKVERGQVAVEIGSAPGGTAYALVQRGAQVICIDPADLDPRVKARHIRKPAGAVEPAELPDSFDWLLIDINDNPGSTMRLAARFVRLSHRRPSLILTLKTSDWSAVRSMDEYCRTLRRLGYGDVTARQLWHGRREIVLFA